MLGRCFEVFGSVKIVWSRFGVLLGCFEMFGKYIECGRMFRSVWDVFELLWSV